MTNLNEIKYVDWQFKLNVIGEVAEGIEDINQCIATILNIPKGSDPHRFTFGSDIYKFVICIFRITHGTKHITIEVKKLELQFRPLCRFCINIDMYKN